MLQYHVPNEGCIFFFLLVQPLVVVLGSSQFLSSNESFSAQVGPERGDQRAGAPPV